MRHAYCVQVRLHVLLHIIQFCTVNKLRVQRNEPLCVESGLFSMLILFINITGK